MIVAEKKWSYLVLLNRAVTQQGIHVFEINKMVGINILNTHYKKNQYNKAAGILTVQICRTQTLLLVLFKIH